MLLTPTSVWFVGLRYTVHVEVYMYCTISRPNCNLGQNLGIIIHMRCIFVPARAFVFTYVQVFVYLHVFYNRNML